MTNQRQKVILGNASSSTGYIQVDFSDETDAVVKINSDQKIHENGPSSGWWHFVWAKQSAYSCHLNRELNHFHLYLYMEQQSLKYQYTDILA